MRACGFGSAGPGALRQRVREVGWCCRPVDQIDCEPDRFAERVSDKRRNYGDRQQHPLHRIPRHIRPGCIHSNQHPAYDDQFGDNQVHDIRPDEVVWFVTIQGKTARRAARLLSKPVAEHAIQATVRAAESQRAAEVFAGPADVELFRCLAHEDQAEQKKSAAHDFNRSGRAGNDVANAGGCGRFCGIQFVEQSVGVFCGSRNQQSARGLSIA